MIDNLSIKLRDRQSVDQAGHRITKDAADYVDHPVGGKRCGGCTMFMPLDGCTLVLGSISSDGHCKYWAEANAEASKSSEHPGGADLHVLPENAVPVQLRQAYPDAVTRANLWHVAWSMVHDGEYATERTEVPLDALIPTQQVVDWRRVAKHESALRARESLEPGQKPPLVLLWDNDYFLLGGHHGCQAACNLGIETVEIDLMKAPK